MRASAAPQGDEWARSQGADPEIARLTSEVHALLGATTHLVSEIDATVVALDVFRKMKRTRMLINKEHSDD